MDLRRKAARVTAILAARYGSPRHNNKRDPLDELVFIILSQMTTYWSFERVFEKLKHAAPSWNDVHRMRLSRLKTLIKDAGLSGQKAPRIKAILARLWSEFGEVTLDCLRNMKTGDAEAYLTSLPGVQKKTAKCVLMYSLHRRVLPVDTHVLRVARRLGFIENRVIGDAVHESLERIFQPALRYRFHVNAVAHGRAICLANNPRCSGCMLTAHCDYFAAQRGCAPSRSFAMYACADRREGYS